MKNLFVSALFLCAGTYASAAELTPQRLIGEYGVKTQVATETVLLNFKILNTKEFELQRLYSDGHTDPTCNGSYKLNPTLFLSMGKLAPGKFFKGAFTCPDDRSSSIEFNIDFTNKTTDDLTKGTEVTVTTSLAEGMKLRAYLKRR
ncbi:MAG: hypothetical protein ACXVCP_01950 [Bdellovibrio sp.]